MISGEEVPKATTVTPTIIGLMRAINAIFEAPRTKNSAPRYNKNNPKKNSKKFISIV